MTFQFSLTFSFVPVLWEKFIDYRGEKQNQVSWLVSNKVYLGEAIGLFLPFGNFKISIDMNLFQTFVNRNSKTRNR